MRKKARFGIFLVLAAAAFAAVAVVLSPLFEIRQIDIVGNSAVSSEDILRQAQIAGGQNILSFSAGDVRRQVNLLPFVADVDVLREFPDRVVISITERRAVANIRLANTSTYLLIDGGGMVLAAGPQAVLGLPVAVGIDFANFTVGEYLNVDDNAIFRYILQLSRVFARYGFFPDVVDLSDPADIVMMDGHIDVLFGSMADADRKMQYVNAIMQQFEAEDRGFIDIKDINLQPRFRLIR